MEKVKYLLITLSFLMISSVIVAQKYNPEIYDERGQYLSELAPAKKEYNEAQLDLFLINNALYPRISLHGYSMYDSGFGVIIFGNVNRLSVSGLAKHGYPLKPGDNLFSVFGSAAVMLDLNPKAKKDNYAFFGLGYYSGKSFFGPIAGLKIENQGWNFFVLGQFAVNGNFKKYPTMEDGFDPDSWYRVYLLRKINKNFSLGLYSERFYLSGFTAEYEIGNWDRMKSVRLKAYVGQELEFGGTTFGFGIKVGTLDMRYGKRY